MIRRGARYVDASGGLTLEGYLALSGMDDRLSALEARLAAVLAVPDATGGGTVDAQARAELVAIKAALA